MNPWTTVAALLRQLPASIRRTLYSIVTAAGAALVVAQLAGWKTIGPIDVDTALGAYALISSPTGFLALANVRPKADGYDDYGGGGGGGGGAYDDDRYDYDEVDRDFAGDDLEQPEMSAEEREDAFT